jgi:hypothetical protein
MRGIAHARLAEHVHGEVDGSSSASPQVQGVSHHVYGKEVCDLLNTHLIYFQTML